MNVRTAPIILGCLLTVLGSGCGAEEPRRGSLPIPIREPREVAPTTERAELSGINGTAMVVDVLPLLMNLLAKYEIAADRYEVVVDGDRVQAERVRLRAVTNEWFALARRDGIPIPTKPDRVRYATTEALSELPATRFAAAFAQAVDKEKREITEVLTRFQRRKLPEAYRNLAGEWQSFMSAAPPVN